jgi:hypothetical protein
VYGAGRLKRFTATGDISTAGQVTIYGFTISPGTAITTVTLREDGGAGTIVGAWVFPANGAAVAFPLCFSIASPHITIAGTAAEVSVVM